MNIRMMEIGENELIRRLSRYAGKRKEILRGIGDDCAVARLKGGTYVFTQDALVENIHFTFAFTDAISLGKKSIYVNVSDVLSMGAAPLFFMITIGVPDTVDYKTLHAFYEGVSRAASEFNVTMLGGDTVSSPSAFFIDISMIGQLVAKKYIGRDTVRTGDLIAVTGVLGESGYGLELLRKGLQRKRGTAKFLARYRTPGLPYDVWQELIKHGIPNGMMDVSDGLIIDLERMMAESKKRALIYFERIPIPRELTENGAEHLALSGGEDYQLLFTFSPRKRKTVESLIRNGYALSIIGEVTEGKGVTLMKEGAVMPVTRKGYEHFGAGR